MTPFLSHSSKRWLVLAPLMTALLLAGCSKGPDANKPKDDKKPKDESVPVEVETIKRGRIEAILKSSTNLEAEEEVKIFSRTSNPVIELLTEEGEIVKKDQVLVRLENDIQKIQVAKAESQLLKAKQEFVRQKSLYDQKLISDQVYQDATHELRQLELSLEDAQRQLDYTEIRAPINGTITKRLVKVGDQVTANQHLFDIIDFDSIVARIYVPEKNLPALSLKQTARVTTSALGTNVFKGYVKRISPVVESKTGTVKVTLGMEHQNLLRPGMYVETELVLATKDDAVLVPKRALVYDRDQLFIYRLMPERKVMRLLMEPNLMDRDFLEPTDGVKEGDQIVVAGQAGLKDGAKVRLPGDPKPVDESKNDKDAAKDKK